MYVPADDEVIGRSLRLYGEWAEAEINLISQCVQRPGLILDVGANIGTHTLALSSRHPECRIIAFEPQADVFALLAASVVFNGCDNVQVLNYGCDGYDHVDYVDPEMFDGLDNRGAVSFSDYEDRAGDSQTIGRPISFLRLDSLARDVPVTFMKIDVEGMELHVLKGSSGLLREDRPTIMFEALDVNKVLKCRDYLNKFGYICYWAGVQAFNPENYNGITENIWEHGELCVFAIHENSLVPDFLRAEQEVQDNHLADTIDALRERCMTMAPSW